MPTQKRGTSDTGKNVSYGIVLLDAQGRVLLAHATGTDHWDIPKGQGDPGESAVDAALREMREETGLEIDAVRLVDLGRFAYRRDKDLYLFAARALASELDLTRCTCTSLFPRRSDGVMIPEMDAYRWVEPDAVADYASGSLARLFATALPLAALHERL